MATRRKTPAADAPAAGASAAPSAGGSAAPAVAGRRDSYHHGNLAAALAEAAEAVLREGGYSGFSLRECARRAGVAHSAPGHHFGDVRGLLTAVAARGFDRLTERMRQARGASTGTAALRACGRGYVAFALADPAVFDLLFQQPERIDRTDARLLQAGQAAFQELVVSVGLARQGRPHRDDDLRFAWSAVHGYACLAIGGSVDPRPPRRAGAAGRGEAPADLDGVLDRVVRAIVG